GATGLGATLRINKNLWTCSLLESGERGLTYHDDWYETERTETVKVVTLDQWATEHEIDRIDVLKLDLQGFEGPALRGARGVLERTSMVLAEAQLIPEYVGAATFADIDAQLREADFELYQIADLCLKGPHREPASCDGLWIKSALLSAIRDKQPSPLLPGVSKAERMGAALHRLAADGRKRVGVYGAGAHTLACAEPLAFPPVEIVGVVDDHPDRHGATLWGLPIMSLETMRAQRPDALVLSSDRFEHKLWIRTQPLRDDGVVVVRLYDKNRTQHDAAA
ncbi:MAG: FkbM family methyltransferase, partial [Planctomycetota bacterium]